MKFATMTCPECGEPAAGSLETIQGRAEFTEPDENGHVDYAGETEMFWDTQEMMIKTTEGKEYVALLCHNGHDWQSEVLSWKES